MDGRTPFRDSGRWIGAFLFVLMMHAGAVGLALGWQTPQPPAAPPPAAVMLELAPLAAPDVQPNDAPPAPELSEAVPEPQELPPLDLKPEEKVEKEEPPPPPRPEKAEVSLPDPEPPPPLDLKPPPKPQPPKPAEKPKPPQQKKPPSTAAAPQATPDKAERAAAPVQGATPQQQSAALPTWKGLLLRHLERHKRYPSEAQRSRHEGVTYVRFVMDRRGMVLSARIERPSGHASLDQEGLELLQRAQPLPALPPDQPGDTLELIVPVQFFLRR